METNEYYYRGPSNPSDLARLRIFMIKELRKARSRILANESQEMNEIDKKIIVDMARLCSAGKIRKQFFHGYIWGTILSKYKLDGDKPDLFKLAMAKDLYDNGYGEGRKKPIYIDYDISKGFVINKK